MLKHTTLDPAPDILNYQTIINSVAGVIESLPHPNNDICTSEFELGSTGMQTRYELLVGMGY